MESCCYFVVEENTFSSKAKSKLWVKLFTKLHNLEKFMQEEGKQKLKSNSIPQSFLNESFGAFVDFASSTGNPTTTLCFKSTGVQSPEKKSAASLCQARPQLILGDIFI